MYLFVCCFTYTRLYGSYIAFLKLSKHILIRQCADLPMRLSCFYKRGFSLGVNYPCYLLFFLACFIKPPSTARIYDLGPIRPVEPLCLLLAPSPWLHQKNTLQLSQAATRDMLYFLLLCYFLYDRRAACNLLIPSNTNKLL